MAEQGTNEEAKIEMAITQLMGIKSEVFSGLEKIVKKFYEFSDVQQVKVNELARNPFMLQMFSNSLSEIGDFEKKDSQADAETFKQQQIRQDGGKMRLFSIMQSGRTKCCMIDDKILYPGDSIGEFKVTRIGDDFVELKLDTTVDNYGLALPSTNVKVTLKLSE